MKVKALITVAGLSSRMQEFKPLMKIVNQYMAEHVIDNLRYAGAKDIVMVTGYRTDELENNLSHKDICFLRNPDYDKSQMYDSVKIGFMELMKQENSFNMVHNNSYKILFTPVDVPLIKHKTIQKLMDVDEKIVVPQYQGRLGHPIVIDSSLISSILNYDGEKGLRGALESTGHKITRINVNDPGIVTDADTQDNYKKIVKLYKQNRKIYLLRHTSAQWI